MQGPLRASEPKNAYHDLQVATADACYSIQPMANLTYEDALAPLIAWPRDVAGCGRVKCQYCPG
ncbi:hypothetical protein MesoLj113b_68920 (plasmid) [Mesorhizobium sp. 113-3-3]|nr:hypothetical protein MesoLj113b_68920 [Mesorhizobium sp. 113-3-3]